MEAAVKRDGAGFEIDTKDLLKKTAELLNGSVGEYAIDGRTFGNDCRIRLKGETFYLLHNKYIQGNQTDIVVCDEDFLEAMLGGRNLGTGYVATLECKNLENNVKRNTAMDLFGRNLDIHTDLSAIIKANGVRNFNWEKTFEVLGILRYDYNSTNFAKDFMTKVSKKDDTTHKMLAANREKFVKYNKVIAEEVHRRDGSRKKYAQYRTYETRAPHLSSLEQIIPKEFPHSEWAAPLNDIVLESGNGSVGFCGQVGFSISAAANVDKNLLLLNFTKGKLDIEILRKMVGNTEMVNAENGIIYQPAGSTMTKNAQAVLNRHPKVKVKSF